MAELSTIARPYAKALFDVYAEASKLADGERVTNALAAAVSHAQIGDLIGHPKVADAELEGLIAAACGDALDGEGKNLLKLLIANDRLAIAPALAAQYAVLKAEAESRIDVTVTAAKPMSDDAKAALSDALAKRLGRQVDMTVDTDESLIGGAVIRAGDMVIDGSVKGRVARIAQTLAA
ncbi:F0F1 ATP synthase subunit delta [bacterium]|nr:F0F1 ATP synthase subunit delta [bacterium]